MQCFLPFFESLSSRLASMLQEGRLPLTLLDQKKKIQGEYYIVKLRPAQLVRVTLTTNYCYSYLPLKKLWAGFLCDSSH